MRNRSGAGVPFIRGLDPLTLILLPNWTNTKLSLPDLSLELAEAESMQMHLLVGLKDRYYLLQLNLGFATEGV